jgi:hypothetical protein
MVACSWTRTVVNQFDKSLMASPNLVGAAISNSLNRNGHAKLVLRMPVLILPSRLGRSDTCLGEA